MKNFPVRIRYLDKNEVQIVNSPEEIQRGRSFVVEELNVKWGRKPVVSAYREDDYEPTRLYN